MKVRERERERERLIIVKNLFTLIEALKLFFFFWISGKTNGSLINRRWKNGAAGLGKSGRNRTR